MTTYNTYQEAKIANPECEIYQLERSGLFAYCTHQTADLVRFVALDSAGVKCNPADYCMTVEKFLGDGCRFVDGDICLGQNDNFLEISGSRLIDGWNDKSQIVDGIDRYVLRAAALEEKPRTKVEYVKVSAPCDFFDLKSEFRCEELSFINGEGNYEVVTTLSELVAGFESMNLYRRIETTITERELFVNTAIELGICFFDGSKLTSANIEHLAGELFDSGKFKLVN